MCVIVCLPVRVCECMILLFTPPPPPTHTHKDTAPMIPLPPPTAARSAQVDTIWMEEVDRLARLPDSIVISSIWHLNLDELLDKVRCLCCCHFWCLCGACAVGWGTPSDMVMVGQRGVGWPDSS